MPEADIKHLDALLQQLICKPQHAKGLDGLWLHGICSTGGSLLSALIEDQRMDAKAGEGEAVCWDQRQ